MSWILPDPPLVLQQLVYDQSSRTGIESSQGQRAAVSNTSKRPKVMTPAAVARAHVPKLSLPLAIRMGVAHGQMEKGKCQLGAQVGVLGAQ